jgi:hypothetical protein
VRVVGADTETKLFGPGNMAPRLVCLQWAEPGRAACLVNRWDAAEVARGWFSDPELLTVWHNASYDLAVLAALEPSLLPLIFRALRENRVTDTMWRQKLADIGRGCYRGFSRNGAWIPLQYDLGSVGRRHGVPVDKDDPWRMRYGELYDTPVQDWPREALDYALKDPVATLAAYEGQRTRYEPGLLVDEFSQTRKFFALHLCAAWGLRTSLRGVMQLEEATLAEIDRLSEWLQELELVRADGSRNEKAARERMAKAWAELGMQPRMTKGGKKGVPQICLDSDACQSSGDPALEAYSEYSSAKKVLSNDIKWLKLGTVHPVHTHFDLAETGRTTSASPNVQNPRRLPGVRECYVPRGFRH